MYVAAVERRNAAQQQGHDSSLWIVRYAGMNQSYFKNGDENTWKYDTAQSKRTLT